MTVVVIGGGITGLAAATRLEAAGRDVRLLEGSARLGGKIETERRDGFVLEWGPHSIVTTGTALFDFAEELGLADAIVPADPRADRRYLATKRGLLVMPRGPGSLLTSSILSPVAKLRLLAEPFVRSRSCDEESAAEFVSRRFGRQVAERFLAPFVSGIYAGDASTLEVASAFPKLVAYERDFGSVLRGAMSAGRSDDSRRRGTFGFRDGMETVVDAAAARLGERASVRTRVDRVDPRGAASVLTIRDAEGTNETIEAEHVIVATPARAAAELLRPIDARVSAALNGIDYASVGLLELGIRNTELPRDLDGFGFLCLPTEGHPLLGCVWASSVFPDRAPEGCALLSVFFGGATGPPVDDIERAATEAQAGLEVVLGGRFDPVLRSVRWIEHAIPQLSIGHHTRRRSIEEHMAEQPGITLAGGHLDGVSLHDCVASGWRAAAEVLATGRMSE